jgi:acetolactate synthase-1/2/3 large subunit
MDVQREQIDPAVQRPFAEGRFGGTVVAGASSAFAARMLHALKDARRPLILAGGGIRSAHAVTGFRKLVRRLRVPVVHSLMAVDVLPYDDPLRVGMIGSYGNRWANHALGDCDVMVVLGSRLDIRQTGADTRAFKGERAIFHVDCEPGELNNRVTGCETLTAGLDEFLRAALDAASGYDAPANAAWSSRIAENRARWPDTEELAALEGINPNAFIHALSAAADPHTAAFVVDVGQHQMWAAQSLELRADQRFLTSGGMGSMGFALPAAIGAAFTAPGRPIVAIAGDGGFQCNIQELETVARNRLPLKIVVLDNGCHGMVRQFQETYFEERYQSTVWGYSAPDFVRVAQAYGIAAASVEEPAGMDAAVRRLWADPHEPMLLRVAIPQLANAYPKLAFGRPITEMEPFAQPIAMEST